MPRRTIALLTDFGIQSPYVGILKGVIYGINPEANIIDLCHDITPYGVTEAAFLLETSYRYLPMRTIFLVVVDPGVGSARKAIASTGDRGVYVAPDNGVLTQVMASDSLNVFYELSAEHYRLEPVSSTFHGRDIFAPAAAYLSNGIDMTSFGEVVEKPVQLQLPRPKAEGSSLVGQVLYIDRFGNLVTNINRPTLQNVLEKYGLRGFLASVGSTNLEQHIEHYGQIQPGALASIFGSFNHLEIVVREGSAAQTLGASIGTPVAVRFFK